MNDTKKSMSYIYKRDNKDIVFLADRILDEHLIRHMDQMMNNNKDINHIINWFGIRGIKMELV